MGYLKAETNSGEQLRILREVEFDGNLIGLVLSVKSIEVCFKFAKEGWVNWVIFYKDFWANHLNLIIFVDLPIKIALKSRVGDNSQSRTFFLKD